MILKVYTKFLNSRLLNVGMEIAFEKLVKDLGEAEKKRDEESKFRANFLSEEKADLFEKIQSKRKQALAAEVRAESLNRIRSAAKQRVKDEEEPKDDDKTKFKSLIEALEEPTIGETIKQKFKETLSFLKNVTARGLEHAIPQVVSKTVGKGASMLLDKHERLMEQEQLNAQRQEFQMHAEQIGALKLQTEIHKTEFAESQKWYNRVIRTISPLIPPIQITKHVHKGKKPRKH